MVALISMKYNTGESDSAIGSCLGPKVLNSFEYDMVKIAPKIIK